MKWDLTTDFESSVLLMKDWGEHKPKESPVLLGEKERHGMSIRGNHTNELGTFVLNHVSVRLVLDHGHRCGIIERCICDGNWDANGGDSVVTVVDGAAVGVAVDIAV